MKNKYKKYILRGLEILGILLGMGAVGAMRSKSGGDLIAGLKIVFVFVLPVGVLYAILSYIWEHPKSLNGQKSYKITKCPFCNTELELPYGVEGKKVECVACSKTFIAPRKEKFGYLKGYRDSVRCFIFKYQLLVSALIIATAIIIHCFFSYNANRYEYSGKSTFDKNTGKIYIGNGKRIIDTITGDEIVRGED